MKGSAAANPPNAPTAKRSSQDGEWLMDLRFPARADRLKVVRSAIHRVAELCGFDTAAVQEVIIAVDEACQNIIRHGYGGDEGDIVIDVRRHDDALVIDLRDFGEPVDVEKVKPRDLDDLRPGGLGTHLIREAMDGVEFLSPPEGERGNILRLTKRIS
jgi:sigma-B regulation protein RsbU (phosphoserine phosphatase)